MNQLTRVEANVPVSVGTAKLIRASVSDNTLKAYRHALKKLETWLGGRGLDDRVLAEYIAELHTAGRSPATIAQAVAAVKWRGLEDAVGEITLRSLAGIRREGRERGRGQVDGLTRVGMERVCSFAEASKTLAGLRDASMIRLMSDCLLRISEVVAVNVEDIGKVLTVRASKTDQEGEGAALYVGTPTHRVIRKYRKAAGIEEGALFRRVRWQKHITPDRLSVNGVRNAIKRWAAEAGVEGFISGHSLRVGSAVSLAQAGASVVDMQTAGRWADPKMPAHYARAELAERGAVVDMQTAGRWADPKMPAHYARAELAERGAVARFFYGK